MTLCSARHPISGLTVCCNTGEAAVATAKNYDLIADPPVFRISSSGLGQSHIHRKDNMKSKQWIMSRER